MHISSPPRALPLVEGQRGVCCAGDPREAEAGARMLELGGNAVDAVAAAAFMGFVVEQVDCGLGGFAHVSAWLQTSQRSLSVDGFVRAPAAAHPDMFEVDPSRDSTYYGHPPTRDDAARYGGLAVAVPGAVAGVCEAHAAGGRLPLAAVIEPAIEQARAGIEVTWRDVLAIAPLQSRIASMPDTAAELLPGGCVPAIDVQLRDGHRRDGTALALTLGAIAQRGPEGFYTGRIAADIAVAVQRAGGILTAEDLEGYRARVASELPVDYRGHACTTCFDHVAYEALQILEGFDLPALDPDSTQYRHLFAEALGIAFTDGVNHYDDPALGSCVVEGLRARTFADERRALISESRALARPIAPGDPWAHCPATPVPRARGSWGFEGTSQMVAADREGNVASVITATGWSFGSLVFVPSVGIFLQNGMSYFDPRPGHNASIAPGKTPMFGAPALVAATNGRGRLAIAGSGGYRIQTGVLHTLSGLVDHGRSVDAAVAHPRVHCQGGATYVDGRIDREVCSRLSALGHDIVVLHDNPGTWHFGRVCAAEVVPDGVRASAGPVWTTAVASV